MKWKWSVRPTVERTPIEAALAVCMAALFSYALEVRATDQVMQVEVALLLAVCVTWCGTLWEALGGIGRSRRWLISGAGAVAAGIYLLATPSFDYESEGWRAFMLVGAAVFLVLAAPALITRDDERANLLLRRVNARLLLRTAGIVLYGLALFAGLALALAAIDNLFELKLHEEIYGHVFVWIMLVLVPWVIFGGIDDYTAPLEEVSPVARVVHKLAGYLVPLLVAIYFLILYTYALRIAITHELPQNLVSPMVIAAGLLSLCALVLFDREHPAGAWLRFTPYATLPLVPLGYWALSTRFSEYGWTEFRYLRVVALVAVFVLMALMAARIARRRSLPLRAIPAVLSIALLLSAVGPWGALAVSRRDQQQRLATALREAGIDPVSAPAASPGATQDDPRHRIPREQFDRITNTSSYLVRNFGTEALTRAVPAYRADTERQPDLALYFGIGTLASATDTMPRNTFSRFGGSVAGVAGGGQFYRVSVPVQASSVARVQLTGDTIRITTPGDTLVGEFRATMDLLAAMPVRSRGQEHALQVVKLRDQAGVERGELIVLEVGVTARGAVRSISMMDALLIVR